jgi:DNA end-binding protein Ku
MPARALGTGTVSFGLVSIPIKLYSATQSSAGVSFNLLHKKCGSRLKQHYICQKDGEKVERDDMVKGYEFSKDRYVMFTPEELEALEEKSSQTIAIDEFVPASKIDPVYFDKAYYLGPDKGGDKAYQLLIEAMKKTGRSALARYAARGKQYLVLLRPGEGGLVMQQLMYADEIRPFAEVPVGEAQLKDAEVALAVQLIDQISSEEFRPEKYEDDVRKRIHELIQRKVEGQEISLAPAEAPQAQVIDLMEALKASLAQSPRAPSAETSSSTQAAAAPIERKPAKRSPRRSAEDAPLKAVKK